MREQVLVRLAGFSKIVVPAGYDPISFDLEDPRVLTFHTDDGMVLFDLDNPDTALASVEEGPEGDEWWLQTPVSEMPCPGVFTLFPDDGGPGFYFLGPANHMLYQLMLKPGNNLPSDEQLVKQGQTFVDSGEADGIRWVEVAYESHGELYTELHNVVQDCAIITLNCPQPADNDLMEVVWDVASRWRLIE